MLRPVLLTAALAVTIIAGSSNAQAQGEGPTPFPWENSRDLAAPRIMPKPLSGEAVSMPPTAATRPAQGMTSAVGSMQSGLTLPFRGSSERDFAADVISHLESAVSMAKMVSQDARDPEVRRLAQGIIEAQGHEIGHLRAILRRLGEG